MLAALLQWFDGRIPHWALPETDNWSRAGEGIESRWAYYRRRNWAQTMEMWVCEKPSAERGARPPFLVAASQNFHNPPEEWFPAWALDLRGYDRSYWWHRSYGWPMRSLSYTKSHRSSNATDGSLAKSEDACSTPLAWSIGPLQRITLPTSIEWVGFLVNTLCVASTAWAVRASVVGVRRRRHRGRGRCPHCGYHVADLLICPECGHRLAPPASPSLPQSPTQVSRP